MERESGDKALGDRIRAARVQAQLTQLELAIRVGLKGEAAVSNYEVGKRSPSRATLALIAKATGTTVSTLLNLEPSVGPGQMEFGPDLGRQILTALLDIRTEIQSLRTDVQELRSQAGASATTRRGPRPR